MTPRVSIIVPIHNVEAYLRACLDSVIAQTCPDWECILVDDASTDASAHIVQEYLSDDRFKLVIHSKCLGLASARNDGIKASIGEYVSFLDADDIIHSHFIEHALNNKADIICYCFCTDQVNKKPVLPFTLKKPKQLLRDILYQTAPVNSSMCGKLLKRELFDGEEFVPGLLYEDLELFPRLMLKAKSVAISPSQFYFYRQREGSIIHTWNEHRLDVLRVTEMIEKRLEFDHELHRAAMDRRFSANCNMLLLLRKNGLKDSLYYHECRRQIRRLRHNTLFNRHTRLKNKLGAILSYFLT